ncbi:hypothetical protein ALC56_10992, partial [Trachymyrmex septentrionalis]
IADALQILVEFLNLNYYNSFIQFGVASFQRRDGGFSFDDSRYPRYKLVGVAKGKGVAGANCARDRENKLSPVAATGMADARCGKVRRDERPVSHPGTSPPTSLSFFSTTNVSRHAVCEYLVTVVSRARYRFISHYRVLEHLTDADCNHYSSSERRPRLYNCGVIFVSGERERERRKQREIGRGCCMDCIVSELVQHCTKRLMMHLGILVEPIERRRVLGERLTLALRAVHSYSAGQVSSLKVATKYFFGGTVSLARPPKGIRKFLLLRVEPTFSGPSGMFMDEYVLIDLIFLAEFHPAKTCIYDTLFLWNAAGIFHEINIDGFESTDTHGRANLIFVSGRHLAANESHFMPMSSPLRSASGLPNNSNELGLKRREIGRTTKVRDFPCDPYARNAEYKWDMDIPEAATRPAVNYTQRRIWSCESEDQSLRCQWRKQILRQH